MNFVELSIKNLKEVDKKLFNLIKEDYDYDCVIFIARGAYLIGQDLAEFNNVPLIEIFAKRKGGKIKSFLKPILQIIPKKLKYILRKKEFNSNFHEKKSARDVFFDEKIWEKYKNCKKILLVDDSVDTGYSILYTKDKIKEYFKKAEVRVAALNCFKKSKKIVMTNYYIYEDTMLKGPWSNDSKENNKYMKMYYSWKKVKR